MLFCSRRAGDLQSGTMFPGSRSAGLAKAVLLVKAAPVFGNKGHCSNLFFFPSNAFMASARSLHTFNRGKQVNCSLHAGLSLCRKPQKCRLWTSTQSRNYPSKRTGKQKSKPKTTQQKQEKNSLSMPTRIEWYSANSMVSKNASLLRRWRLSADLYQYHATH